MNRTGFIASTLARAWPVLAILLLSGCLSLGGGTRDQAWPLEGGLGRVVVDGRWGAVDSTGREVIPPRYEALSDAAHGMLVALQGGRSGAVSGQGAVLVPFEFEKVEPLAADLVRVERAGRMAYFKPSAGRMIWKEEGFDVAASPQ